MQFKQPVQNFPIFLAFSSGLLWFLAWPMSPAPWFAFIAFVPLLILADSTISKTKYLVFLYLAFFIWNTSTTWWVYNASAVGGIGAFVANSWLMCLPWLFYRKLRKKNKTWISYVALVSFWLAFEFGHLHDWGLSWPWLTIGNVFANSTWAIQWYEYTGTSGGTFWVLLINILVYEIFKNKLKIKVKIASLVSLIVLPLLASVFIGYAATQFTFNVKRMDKKPNKIVVVQPNIDPWSKLEDLSEAAQLKILINTSSQKVDSTTDILIWPETALYSRYSFDETKMKQRQDLTALWQFLAQHPKMKLITGVESINFFEQATANSMQVPNSNLYYEKYNAASLLDSTGAKQFYHKSMLVPGAETLPWFLQFLAAQFSDFGGTTNGYTRNHGRTNLRLKSNVNVAPSICYESIYGGFMSQYFKTDGHVLAIITNDGWWRNTPGHKQHFAYAKLRAIENRRYVVRSANTGISGFIDPSGQTLNSLGYNQQGSVAHTVRLLDFKTFYTKFPDLIYWFGLLLTPILLIITYWKKKN